MIKKGQERDRKIEEMRKKAIQKENQKCTFHPKVNPKSEKIVDAYKQVFRAKSKAKAKQNRLRSRPFSTQHPPQRYKSYKKMHFNRGAKAAKENKIKQKRKRYPTKHEYLKGFDRNKKNAVFQHLYQQKNVTKARKLLLVEKLHKEECPFKPQISNLNKKNKKTSFQQNFEGASSKFDMANFEQRNQIFLDKKELKRKQILARQEEDLFVPNAHKKKSSVRSGLHQRLYEEQEKENFRKERLQQKYRVKNFIEYLLHRK